MSTLRFLYHASAVGLSGEIRRPFPHTIDVQAASALPRYGGRAAARHGIYQLPGIVSHQGAATEAASLYNRGAGAHETTVFASVTQLDLRSIVTAGALAAAVRCAHSADGQDEPSIGLGGSEIRGLRIAGREIVLESRVDLYSRLDTMALLRDYYRDNAEFREDFDRAAFVGQSERLPADLRRFFPWRRYTRSTRLPEHRGMTVVPLFTVKNASEPGLEIYGNVIRIHDFGIVQLGELIVESHRRRVMMLHADMGSPVEGEVTASCVDGNGSAPPPDGGSGGGN